MIDRQLTLKVFVSSSYPGKESLLLDFLPPAEAELVAKQETQGMTLAALNVAPEEWLKPFHFSWLAHYIEQQPSSIRPFTLQALDEPLRSRVAATLGIDLSGLESLAAVVRDYFLRRLKQVVLQKSVLPLSCLQPAPLLALLSFKGEELASLIDLLGLHDLALEIRHVVETKRLQKIYAALPIWQQKYLKTCLHLSAKSLNPKLNLQGWDGDEDRLKKALHYRGLLRLSCALSGHSSDFIWHLSHRLDKGRGDFLMKRFSREEIPGYTPAMIIQVNHALAFLKSQRSS